jgi:hypothetical protein
MWLLQRAVLAGEQMGRVLLVEPLELLDKVLLAVLEAVAQQQQVAEVEQVLLGKAELHL